MFRQKVKISSLFTNELFTAKVLKSWYLQNEKVSEAQILSGLYWEYMFCW